MNLPFRQVVFRPFMLFMSTLFCGVLLYPWPGLSGSGLTRTVNLMTWILMGMWGIWLTAFLSRKIWVAKTSALLFAGLLLLNLPALWTPPIFRAEALYRLAGTGALAILLWMLLPVCIRGGQRRALYAVVVLAALLQAIEGGWQVIFPRSAAHWLGYDFSHAGGRATGAFGQANLLGSFLATGMLCSLWLMLSAGRPVWRRLAGIMVIPLCAVLMLSESRSAWLGAIAGVVILLICAGSTRRRLQMAVVLVAGVLAGIGSQSLRPSVMVEPVTVSARLADAVPVSGRLAADRSASGHERRALVKGALLLVAAHPLAGNGIGSFETAFPVALARSGYINPFPVTVAHPHNELLYVWCEGGLVALAGLLCWLALWLKPLRPITQVLSQGRQTGIRHVVARGALTLPLMGHVMTEFPFYLSAAHGVLMVLLLWLSLPAMARRTAHSRGIPVVAVRGIKAGMVIFCLSGAAFMITGLQSSLNIQAAERFYFNNTAPLARVMNPLAQPQRLQFDLAEEKLLRFNGSRDARWLRLYQQQAQDWLSLHNDAYLTDAMMRIAQVQKDKPQAEYWRQRGCQSFHLDPRFNCDFVTQNDVESSQ